MKMIIIQALFAVCIFSSVFAQNHSFGVTVGVGKGFILKKLLTVGPSLDLNTGISVGLQYDRKVASKLHLVTGLHWYTNSVSVTPAFYPGNDMTPKKYDIQLLYLPAFLRFDLSEYIFLQGGPIVDVDITKAKYITNQSGIGAGLGIGTEFSINETISLQLSPYIIFHGLMLTQTENYPERIFDAGIKLSVMLHH